MKIKTMLRRLQTALNQDHLAEQLLLQPGVSPQSALDLPNSTNLVIAYSGSPNSHVALDLALWVAHQTRLATARSVTVHVVYVLQDYRTAKLIAESNFAKSDSPFVRPSGMPRSTSESTALMEATNGAELETLYPLGEDRSFAGPCQSDLLDQVDRILWEARHLAEEWRGSLETHLRFGDLSSELCQVVEAEAADALFVGCSSIQHPLMQQLTPRFPCPIVGIPQELEQ